MRMRKLKETYGDASANSSLWNKLNAKKDGAGGHESKKKNENGLGIDDVVKLGK